MEIGNKIKQLRFKAGMTQEQLAAKLGITAQSVSIWENAVSMPDITLLPALSGELGVSIDELFDLTVDQKLRRIEKSMDIEQELPSDIFAEYESFLKNWLDEADDKRKILSLLAHLYHHRMESDSKKASQYAKMAIEIAPEIKECQWILQKSDGAVVWDWNVSNHTEIINFYKSVIENDPISPHSPLPYYELMDNLLADGRVDEAEKYFEIYKTLPAHKPFLIPIYESTIALARHDVKKADSIMENALSEFSCDSGFLFESAQYYARKCDYEKALAFYEASFEIENKPRYTDALEGMAIIYGIMGDTEKALESYDRMIECIKTEWGYKDTDAATVEVEMKKKSLAERS